jgi:hypothetical protein
MLDFLKWMFSDFWIFIGMMMLLGAAGAILIEITKIIFRRK